MKWYLRARYYGLLLAGGGLYVLGGCGLSDQQLAQVWQSVITAGLNTIMNNVLNTALPAATTG